MAFVASNDQHGNEIMRVVLCLEPGKRTVASCRSLRINCAPEQVRPETRHGRYDHRHRFHYFADATPSQREDELHLQERHQQRSLIELRQLEKEQEKSFGPKWQTHKSQGEQTHRKEQEQEQKKQEKKLQRENSQLEKSQLECSEEMFQQEKMLRENSKLKLEKLKLEKLNMEQLKLEELQLVKIKLEKLKLEKLKQEKLRLEKLKLDKSQREKPLLEKTRLEMFLQEKFPQEKFPQEMSPQKSPQMSPQKAPKAKLVKSKLETLKLDRSKQEKFQQEKPQSEKFQQKNIRDNSKLSSFQQEKSKLEKTQQETSQLDKSQHRKMQREKSKPESFEQEESQKKKTQLEKFQQEKLQLEKNQQEKSQAKMEPENLKLEKFQRENVETEWSQREKYHQDRSQANHHQQEKTQLEKYKQEKQQRKKLQLEKFQLGGSLPGMQEETHSQELDRSQKVHKQSQSQPERETLNVSLADATLWNSVEVIAHSTLLSEKNQILPRRNSANDSTKSPNSPFYCWLAAKNEVKQQQALDRRLNAQLEDQRAEERARLAQQKYEHWMRAKASQLRRAKSDVSSLQTAATTSTEDVQRRLLDWEREKLAELKTQRMQREALAAQQQLMETMRRELSTEAWEQWVATARHRPKPVAMGRGLDSLRASNAPLFENPNAWQSLLPAQQPAPETEAVQQRRPSRNGPDYERLERLAQPRRKLWRRAGDEAKSNAEPTHCGSCDQLSGTGNRLGAQRVPVVWRRSNAQRVRELRSSVQAVSVPGGVALRDDQLEQLRQQQEKQNSKVLPHKFQEKRDQLRERLRGWLEDGQAVRERASSDVCPINEELRHECEEQQRRAVFVEEHENDQRDNRRKLSLTETCVQRSEERLPSIARKSNRTKETQKSRPWR